MLELVKNQNKKSAIFIRRTSDGAVASFVIFDSLNNAHILGEKVLNREELGVLIKQKTTLEEQNILIIEERLAVVLLISSFVKRIYATFQAFVFSEENYTSKLQLEFLTTQKTRGPNK